MSEEAENYEFPTGLRERFLAKVERQPDGCWLWTAYKNPKGYGLISVNDRLWQAHRVAHELFKGAIPAGFDVHHRCYQRSCVNPDHLEAISHRANITDAGSTSPSALNAKKTHCLNGHQLVVPNLMLSLLAKGRRRCKSSRPRTTASPKSAPCLTTRP